MEPRGVGMPEPIVQPQPQAPPHPYTQQMQSPLQAPQPYPYPYPYPQPVAPPPSKPDGIVIRLWRAAYPVLVVLGVQALAGVVLAAVLLADPMTSAFANVYDMSWFLLMGAVASQVVAAPFLIAFRIMDSNRLRAKGTWKTYRLPGFGKLVVCLILGIAMAMLALCVFELVGYGDDGTQAHLFSMNPVAAVLVIGLIGPAIEELTFRVLLFGRLREWMSPISAGLLSALVFTLAHGNVTQGITAFFYGLALALVYERYKTFWAPFLLHAGINSTVVLTAVAGRSFIVLLPGPGLLLMALACLAIVVGLAVFVFRSAPAKEKDAVETGSQASSAPYPSN